MLTPTSVIVRSREPLTANVDNEIVMLSPDQGSYFGLNEVASRIWELIAEPTSVAAVCTQLTREYDVTADTCNTDVISLLDELLQSSLIDVRD